MRSRFCSSASTITLPTKWTLSAGTPSQIRLVDRLALGREQQVRHRVGGDAVDLLGHLAVEAAQAGLDVGHRDAELDRGERGGERRVDVAHHQHQVGRVLLERALDALHRARGLDRVRAGPHLQEDVGTRQPEVAEEDAGELAVVVLPGVEQERLDRRPRAASRRTAAPA